MIKTILLSMTAFVGTNIDDLLINTFLMTEAKSKTEYKQIVIGKYLGMAMLIGLSLLTVFGLQLISPEYLKLLGIIPIGLGIKIFLIHARNPNVESGEVVKSIPSNTNPVVKTALLTVANGADNLGVYIPLFATFQRMEILAAIIVFFGMTGLWCTLSKRVSEFHVLNEILRKHDRWIVPAVYIWLGIYILL